MSNRLEIRGVIVPSDYDTDWMASYIERGMITPESRFRRQLAEADPGEPLEVYVNSPGGSVFSGNEMINAVREWKGETGQPVNVTVGAMAASMGAAFTISAADTVRVHSNAKMMFHGAWGGAVGGAEAMADYSDLLNQINADIKAVLLSRYDLAPETVDEWFSEGREGWLSADQMKEVGIAQEVVGDTADGVQFASSDVADLASHGLKLAALVDVAGLAVEDDEDNCDPEPEHEPEDTDAGSQPDDPNAGDEPSGEDDPQPSDDPDAGDDPEPEPEEEPEDEIQPEPSDAVKAAIVAEAKATMRVEVMADIAEEIEDLQCKVQKRDELIARLQSERDRIGVENENLKSKVKELEARYGRLIGASLKFSPTVETWEEALAASDGDYAKARKSYPDAYAAYMRRNRP